MSFKQTTGSRAQVMHGNATKTSGGLTKSQLKYNKQDKIVSKKASALAKKNNRLVKAGYTTQKGVFGCEQMGGMRLWPLRTLRNNKKKVQEVQEAQEALFKPTNSSHHSILYFQKD